MPWLLRFRTLSITLVKGVYAFHSSLVVSIYHEKRSSKEFCFFTDIAPTIYDLVGLSTSANEGYAPITGKSMLPHIGDKSLSIYAPNEGIGLEVANSSAYFLNGYKIVKNNIPMGDNSWHMYDLTKDPGEVNDIALTNAVLFQKMLSEYQTYEKEVGVIKMPKGYSAQGEVGKKINRNLAKICCSISPAFFNL